MSSDKEYMISTKDNPYNYFTEFDQWNRWDQAKGYHTLAYLARVTRTSHELPQALQDAAIDEAIEDILNENPFGPYIKIERPDETETPQQV